MIQFQRFKKEVRKCFGIVYHPLALSWLELPPKAFKSDSLRLYFLCPYFHVPCTCLGLFCRFQSSFCLNVSKFAVTESETPKIITKSLCDCKLGKRRLSWRVRLRTPLVKPLHLLGKLPLLLGPDQALLGGRGQSHLLGAWPDILSNHPYFFNLTFLQCSTKMFQNVLFSPILCSQNTFFYFKMAFARISVNAWEITGLQPPRGGWEAW